MGGREVVGWVGSWGKQGLVVLLQSNRGFQVENELLRGVEEGPQLNGPGGIRVGGEELEEVEGLENREGQAVVQVGEQQRAGRGTHTHLSQQGIWQPP